MKKIIFSSALLLSGLLVFISCGKDNVYFSKSYVSEYWQIKSIRLEAFDNKIHIRANEEAYIGNIKYPNSMNGKFGALCKRHGDLSYNREVKYDESTQSFPHVFYSNDYSSIQIVSNADFDETHPAGTSLADIVRFVSASPMPYIRSGYKDTYDWSRLSGMSHSFRTVYNEGPLFDRGNIKSSIFPVDKMVRDLSSADLMLLGRGDGFNMKVIAVLYFESRPTVSKTHNITVTLTDTEGKVFKETVLMEF